MKVSYKIFSHKMCVIVILRVSVVSNATDAVFDLIIPKSSSPWAYTVCSQRYFSNVFLLSAQNSLFHDYACLDAII